MNSYETARALGIAGTSDDATEFATLQTYGLTHRSINRAELMFNLNLLGMLQKVIGNNSDEKWRGTVLTMQDAINAGGTVDQQKAMALWLSHITNTTNIQWDTTRPEYAAGFWGMYVTFRDKPGMPTSQEFAAIAALGGGWVATTVEDYTSDRKAYEDELAEEAKENTRNDWRQRFDAALNTLGTVEQADGVAAVRAIADELEAA